MDPASNVIGSKQGIGWSPLTGLNVKGMPLALGGLAGMLGGGGGLSGLFGGHQQPQPEKKKPEDTLPTPSLPMPGVPGASDTDTFNQATKMLTQNPTLAQTLSGGTAPAAGAFGGAGLGTGAGGAAGNALASTAGTGAAGALASAMPYLAAYEALKGPKSPNRTESGAGFGVG